MPKAESNQRCSTRRAVKFAKYFEKNGNFENASTLDLEIETCGLRAKKSLKWSVQRQVLPNNFLQQNKKQNCHCSKKIYSKEQQINGE